jgi:hypothetical protein
MPSFGKKRYPQFSGIVHLSFSTVIDSTQGNKPLTLGDLIESGYRLCGKRRANAILRLAAKARLVLFQSKGRFTIS